jgi:hypothetical protein
MVRADKLIDLPVITRTACQGASQETGIKSCTMYLSSIQGAEQPWMGNQILEMVLLTFMLAILIYLVIRLPKQRIVNSTPNVSDQLLLRKRMEVYDTVARQLYQLLCFFSYNGTWTTISPPQVLLIRAEMEREMDTYGQLFTEDLKELYHSFVKMCFVSSSGWEHDLKIKSNYVLRKDHFPGWEDEWVRYFDNKNVVDAVVLRETYHQIIDSFWRSIH